MGNRFIDILALDKDNNYVVIELKVSRGYDRVVGQILRYMGWLRKNQAESGQLVRGIIVAREISDDLLWHARLLITLIFMSISCPYLFKNCDILETYNSRLLIRHNGNGKHPHRLSLCSAVRLWISGIFHCSTASPRVI